MDFKIFKEVYIIEFDLQLKMYENIFVLLKNLKIKFYSSDFKVLKSFLKKTLLINCENDGYYK